MIDDSRYLLLSQLTHAGYCLRRAALVMNEQAWKENADTAKGRAEHERVHTQRIERRGDSIKLYEYDVFSEKLELRGKCDCIEAQACESGCMIPTIEFPVSLFPIEYKHGKVREEREYEIQLCAQAMCLEDMFDTEISEGVLFYTSSHRRYPVKFTQELRKDVIDVIEALKQIRDSHVMPQAEFSTKCKKCSLYDLCLPKVQRSAQSYCRRLKKEAEEIL